jgi:CheY-like chemotaxis protein
VAPVLIVSRDGGLRNDLAMDLSDRGHETYFAAEPFEALRLLKARAFAAAIIDLALPEPGGYGLLARIRTEEQFRYLLAVLIDPARRQGAEGCRMLDGVTAVLARPLDRQALARVLAPALVFQQSAQAAPGLTARDEPAAAADDPAARRLVRLCHDLNNPLAVITGQVELIAGTHPDLPEDLERRLHEIAEAAQNMRALLRTAAEARGRPDRPAPAG